jgi:putative acetyltransferase
VFFIVARLDGVAVGCVAMVKCGDYVEVKRLFVSPDGRGHGIGRGLMENFHLRAEAIDIPRVRLETGDKLAEAVKLYRSLGYVEIGPFGEYEDLAVSLFMEKIL